MQTYVVQSARLLSARVKVPAHAVYRSFPSRDVCELCRSLLERGLIELDGAA